MTSTAAALEAEVEVLSDASHAVLVDESERIAEIVRRFVERHDRR